MGHVGPPLPAQGRIYQHIRALGQRGTSHTAIYIFDALLSLLFYISTPLSVATLLIQPPLRPHRLPVSLAHAMYSSQSLFSSARRKYSVSISPSTTRLTKETSGVKCACWHWRTT